MSKVKAHEQIESVVAFVREVAESETGVRIGVDVSVPAVLFDELDGEVIGGPMRPPMKSLYRTPGGYVNAHQLTEAAGRQRIEKVA